MASQTVNDETAGCSMSNTGQILGLNFRTSLNDATDSSDSEQSAEEFSFGLSMFSNGQHFSDQSKIQLDKPNVEYDSVANEYMNVLNDLDHILDKTLLVSYNCDNNALGFYPDNLSAIPKESNFLNGNADTIIDNDADILKADCIHYDSSSDSDRTGDTLEGHESLSGTFNNVDGSSFDLSTTEPIQNGFNRNFLSRATISNHTSAPKLSRIDLKRKSLNDKYLPDKLIPVIKQGDPVSKLNESFVLEISQEGPREFDDAAGEKLSDSFRILRDSMRHVEPLEMPDQEPNAANQEFPHERITLPVMLFLERHSNIVRPTSAPVVTSGPSLLDLPNPAPNSSPEVQGVVGRRALRQQPISSLHISPEHVLSASRIRRDNDQTRRNSRTRERERRDHSISRSVSLASSSNSSANSSLEGHLQDSDDNNRDVPSTSPQKELNLWPFISFGLSCLSCSIGMFNISRFSIFAMRFGINFIAQFLILSLVFGIPLFVLNLCVGHTLRKSIIGMWYISPIFQGIGIALWMSQAVLGVYTIVGVSWLFTYLRDSFVTNNNTYKWTAPIFGLNTTSLKESIPLYFNEVVLQRSVPENIASQSPISILTLGTIKFQVAFNLAVVWLILFVAHCKGIRSSGKAVYVFTILPMIGMLMMCVRLSMSYNALDGPLFPETIWSDFFINSKSWLAAAQESFLTWGLLGAATQTVGADGSLQGVRSVFFASALTVAVTFLTLYIGSLIGVASLAVLIRHGYRVSPASFEDQSSAIFMHTGRYSGSNTPMRYMSQYASMLGMTTWQPSYDPAQYSGYQPLELSTDLVPAAVAALGAGNLSPFWPVIFYLTMILFGLGQQLALWRGVVAGVVSMDKGNLHKKEATITFFSCIIGFLIGLPLTTDAGLNILHWLDFVSVGGWCQCLLWSALVVAVLAVRGRPYTGDRLVKSLYPCPPRQPPTLCASLLSFTWSVLLPVLLLVVCVVDFKAGRQRQLFIWHSIPNRYSYWSAWSRQIGGGVQLGLLLVVPFVAMIQTYRYLNSHHPDILVRVQNLYRPALADSEEVQRHIPILRASSDRPPSSTVTNDNSSNGATVNNGPPPKYSPPPSYSTATGAAAVQLARLRQSFRRGVARITSTWGEPHSTVVPVSVERADVTEVPHENVPGRISRGVRSASLRCSNGSSLLRNALRRSLQRSVTGNRIALRNRSTEQLLARPDLLADHVFTVSGNIDNSAPSDSSV